MAPERARDLNKKRREYIPAFLRLLALALGHWDARDRFDFAELFQPPQAALATIARLLEATEGRPLLAAHTIGFDHT